MKTRSAKAKGRRLQSWVRERLVELLKLDPDKVRCAVMGEGGADVQLDKDVHPHFPYDIECKNQEKYKGIYDAYEQASQHGKNEPLVVIKMNKRKPLILVDAEHFIRNVRW